MDRLSFEKIYYHKKHLNEILEKGDSYPIHLELGLNNFCNHDCEFCAASLTKFKDGKTKRIQIDKTRLFEIIDEMHSLGLRSITLVGSGEPTLHKDFVEIIDGIKDRGVEIGLFTNGSNVKGKISQAIIDYLTFVRFSVTGASNKVHEMAHGTRDFYKIIDNINNLVKLRGDKNFPTIGMQFILIHYSANDLFDAIKIAKDIGVDYFAIKPVIAIKGARSSTSDLSLENALDLIRKAKKLEDNQLEIHIKPEQTKIVYENDPVDRPYKRCLGSNTTTALEADFNLYICDNQFKEEFCLGNLKNKSFKEVWHGDRRKEILSKLDVTKCPVACRMDPLNRIIEKIINNKVKIPEKLPELRPEDHINFI